MLGCVVTALAAVRLDHGTREELKAPVQKT